MNYDKKNSHIFPSKIALFVFISKNINDMLKAYKYKIKPNAQQQELLSKFFGCVRFIYNWGLNAKTSAYKENGKKIGYVQLAKELTSLKKQQDYE